VGLVPYGVAARGGLLTAYLTLAICAVVALFYALPATTTDGESQAGIIAPEIEPRQI